GQPRVWLHVPCEGVCTSLAWQNTGGAASGSMPFAIPATLAPGTYELRLFAEQFSGRLAVSNTFTVTACTTATLGASPARVPPGTSSITATWSGICAPNGHNRIGPHTPGAADGRYLAWPNAGGAARGRLASLFRATLAPGTYELRLFAEQFSGRLATSNAFAVAPPTATPTATSSPTATPTATSTPSATPTSTATATP